MTIGRLLDGRQTSVITCSPETTVAEAVAILAERRIGALPVIDNHKVLGIFSERDLVYRLAQEGAATLDHPVSEVMTAPAHTVERDLPVLAALSMMTKRRVRHLPVLEYGRMVGFVSIGDLVKYRMDMIEAEAEAMREYIQTA
jgi:CBS domain-containing protein